jgi:uncharacterized membrane protein YbjE (DUF340 family)
MFLVGISIGGDEKSLSVLKLINIKLLLVPIGVVIGSLLGAGVASFFIEQINLKEALAVGSGFGYYSLSSIIISKLYSESLGAVALMSNVTREIFTLIFTPQLVKYFGKLAPIGTGGATTMDTTLSVITRYSGKDYALIAVFSGVVLTILVPLLVTFIIKY